MRTHLAPAAVAVLLAACMASPGVAAAPPKARPIFAVVPANVPWHRVTAIHPSGQLTQWNGSFTDQHGLTVTYTMVGNDPSTSNRTVRTPVVIIPIKMVYGANNGNMTFDPTVTKLPNKRTVLKNTLISPIFKKAEDYVQGGTDLGKTQYIDAFQRGSFWSLVSTNNKYHTLLAPVTVAPTQEFDVPVGEGSVMNNPFGSGVVGTMEVDLFDMQVQTWISQLSSYINPGVLPIFLTYDIYLTEDGDVCCVGGYHSNIGSQPSGQTYAYTTYEDSVGSFAQDVSALSHEVGEWEDDPFTDNNVNCADNTLMEVGDPLENNANYGAWPYSYRGFTYNLQSLVFIGYFGAPTNISVNSWLSFQNDESSRCPGQ